MSELWYVNGDPDCVVFPHKDGAERWARALFPNEDVHTRYARIHFMRPTYLVVWVEKSDADHYEAYEVPVAAQQRYAEVSRKGNLRSCSLAVVLDSTDYEAMPAYRRRT